MQKYRPVMLVIMDGWGFREDPADNAVRQAHTPAFDHLWATSPHSLLRTSGKDVGLPPGQMGNSEVGHLNIGAGRVVVQDLPRVGDAIASGDIARAPALVNLIGELRQSGGTCHLMGLISPGGVHSHQDHAVALAKILAKANIPAVVHAFTDGRDTPPRMAEKYMAELNEALPPQAAVIGGYGGMRDGDGVLCFNFRADRVREILAALLDPAFSAFPRRRKVRLSTAVGMTPYSKALDKFMQPIFPPQNLSNVLGEVVAAAGLTQLRMAETEKYPHVTYFLNGGREDSYPGEDRIMVPSPKVATYDLQPEMSAPELTHKALEVITSGKYDLIVLNYANPDMVGHTGILSAAIKAVEVVDTGVGQLAQAVHDAGGALLVTADHGNCELMRDPETGGAHTAHTTNPVPLLLIGPGDVSLAEGRLSDIAPTLLELMNLPKPVEMTGVSLLRHIAAAAGSLVL